MIQKFCNFCTKLHSNANEKFYDIFQTKKGIAEQQRNEQKNNEIINFVKDIDETLQMKETLRRNHKKKLKKLHLIISDDQQNENNVSPLHVVETTTATITSTSRSSLSFSNQQHRTHQINNNNKNNNRISSLLAVKSNQMEIGKCLICRLDHCDGLECSVARCKQSEMITASQNNNLIRNTNHTSFIELPCYRNRNSNVRRSESMMVNGRLSSIITTTATSPTVTEHQQSMSRITQKCQSNETVALPKRTKSDSDGYDGKCSAQTNTKLRRKSSCPAAKYTTTNVVVDSPNTIKCNVQNSVLSSMATRTLRNFSIPNYVTLIISSLLMLNLSISLTIVGAATNGGTFGQFSRNSSEVCRSMDIRNNPKELSKLSGCRVIEGFLMLSLMDKTTLKDYENLSFPLLTEITDFMIVYRMTNLTRLGNLFPSLSVIRGNNVFEGYALAILENEQLQYIGLTALTYIKKGGVRIERNPQLCHANTIDWSKITANTSVNVNFFKANKHSSECPICPEDKNSKYDSVIDTYLAVCNISKTGQSLCWERDHCQKICPDYCGNLSCNNRGQCCHESCIGGCSDFNVTSCTVCKSLSIGPYANKTCTDKCPQGYFKYQDHRCISAGECLALPKPLTVESPDDHSFIPFRDECSTQCPHGYEKHNNVTCIKCQGRCIKKCYANNIDTISAARKLRGCTIITSPLIINIRKVQIFEELTTSLATIEEIQGYLKITNSFAIISLSFFKNLKVIHGAELENDRYSLYIFDNANLMHLFNENQTIDIQNGKIFFHFNPKLCYYKIEQLIPMIAKQKGAAFDNIDVDSNSNGVRTACNLEVLNATVTKIQSKAVVIQVGEITFEDDRVFLGYQYYYTEAPYQNLTIYDSRQACGNDGWNVDDDTKKEKMHLLTQLKPYTQYGFYVKTFTIASETRGGQSNIGYFRTAPDTPEPPRNLRALTNGSSEIVIEWDPPRVANGNLTEYLIRALLTREDETKLLTNRNYCNDPIKSYFAPQYVEDDRKVTTPKESKDIDCNCDSNGLVIDESEAENVIEFEDALQNFIYVKRTESTDPINSRKQRSIEKKKAKIASLRRIRCRRNAAAAAAAAEKETPGGKSSDTHEYNEFPSENVTNSKNIDSGEIRTNRTEGEYYITYYATVDTSVTSFVFRNLKHFSTYSFGVVVCRSGGSEHNNNCSLSATITGRTLKIDNADDIKNLDVTVEGVNNTRSIVRLKWLAPENPNSFIVSYSIRYNRTDIEHSKPIEKCITQLEYRNLTSGYVLRGLDPGNYSVQVKASSLAGDGNYTSAKYFYIPPTQISTSAIVGIVFSVIIFLGLVILTGWYVHRRCLPPPADLKLFTSVNPEYVSMQYTPDEWEIPRDKIIQLRELGQGSFGMVYEGIVKNLNKDMPGDLPCAIKTVNENATDRERINFLNEASVMKAFDTFHVVRLLGVVSRGQPTLVVMELMTNGDLKGYLRSHRPDAENLNAGDPLPQPPTLKRILQMAVEIADGMAYLSAKKFVHRDLAARNCMVAEDLTVKIGDFGMTRDIYETDYYRKGTKGLLPVRWMAPESLKDGVFTSACDVFSYGVVLWEMATLASQPYQGLSNDQVLRYVIDGGVMERPENCPDKLYNLMRKCWQHRPTSRPSFMEIIQSLLDDTESKFRNVSFYHSAQGQEILQQMNRVPDPDDVTTPLRMEDEEFEMVMDRNFLDRTDMGHDDQPRSPFSFGETIKFTPLGGVSKSSKRNSPSFSIRTTTTPPADRTPATRNTISKNQSVQNSNNNNSNSIVPPVLRRMNFLRKPFSLVTSSSSNSNNNNNNSSSSNHGNVGGGGNNQGSRAAGNTADNSNGAADTVYGFSNGENTTGGRKFGESIANFFNFGGSSSNSGNVDSGGNNTDNTNRNTSKDYRNRFNQMTTRNPIFGEQFETVPTASTYMQRVDDSDTKLLSAAAILEEAITSRTDAAPTNLPATSTEINKRTQNQCKDNDHKVISAPSNLSCRDNSFGDGGVAIATSTNQIPNLRETGATDQTAAKRLHSYLNGYAQRRRDGGNNVSGISSRDDYFRAAHLQSLTNKLPTKATIGETKISGESADSGDSGESASAATITTTGSG